MALGKLPRWRPNIADGCSVPWFAQYLDAETREAVLECDWACLPHDEEYHYGGTEAERLESDYQMFERLRRRLRWLGHSRERADAFALSWFTAVRLWGGSRWRKPLEHEQGAQQA